MFKGLTRSLGIIVVLGAVLPLPHSSGQAAVRVVSQAMPLVENSDVSFVQPRWSPDGSRIAFTSENYRGIWVSDSEGEGVAQISDDRAAGFGFSWSPDGSAIVARVARYDGLRRSDALKRFDLVEPGERLLTEYRADMPTLPVWTRDGSHLLLAQKAGVEVLAAEPAAGKTISAEPVLVVRGDRIAIARPGPQGLTDLQGVPDGHPINLAQSPDGFRSAFEIVGSNLFIASSDGVSVVDIGPGHRPQWSPDGNWVVYMKTEDDGHVITSSELYAARADGSVTVQLTNTSDAMEMNPSWSPDGSRIAFDDRGTLYTIQVSNER